MDISRCYFCGEDYDTEESDARNKDELCSSACEEALRDSRDRDDDERDEHRV
jgi:hypothetical protein